MEKNIIDQEIIALAERTKYYADLLIAQCDSWLSEEEGMRNMEQRFREKREKAKNEALAKKNAQRGILWKKS